MNIECPFLTLELRLKYGIFHQPDDFRNGFLMDTNIPKDICLSNDRLAWYYIIETISGLPYFTMDTLVDTNYFDNRYRELLFHSSVDYADMHTFTEKINNELDKLNAKISKKYGIYEHDRKLTVYK